MVALPLPLMETNSEKTPNQTVQRQSKVLAALRHKFRSNRERQLRLLDNLLQPRRALLTKRDAQHLLREATTVELVLT